MELARSFGESNWSQGRRFEGSGSALKLLPQGRTRRMSRNEAKIDGNADYTELTNKHSAGGDLSFARTIRRI